MSTIFEIGKCTRCQMVVYSGKPGVDYVIIAGFGLVVDYLWHRHPTDCALQEHQDPNSDWYHIIFENLLEDK